MKRTKIVCTIGPASESKEMLTKLVKAGMNVMRLNFSHGTHEEHEEKINTLLEINKEKIKAVPFISRFLFMFILLGASSALSMAITSWLN